MRGFGKTRAALTRDPHRGEEEEGSSAFEMVVWEAELLDVGQSRDGALRAGSSLVLQRRACDFDPNVMGSARRGFPCLGARVWAEKLPMEAFR